MKRDLRRYTRQTNVRLIVGFLIILLLVGDGLIWAFWGKGAAITGLLCIAGGLFPIGLIASLFVLMDWVVKKLNE